MLYTDYRIEVLISSITLCIPVAFSFFIQQKLNDRAVNNSEGEKRRRTIARLHTIFKFIYILYFLISVAVAIIVAWILSDFAYARLYILPVAFSVTCWILNDRRKKSSDASDILAKVISSFAEYSRKTRISGVQLAKENVPKRWPPFALFLRSFHFEKRVSNPFVVADLGESEHEWQFMQLIEKELNLFVLGLGRQEVLQGAARIQLPRDFDWKTAVFWLAAAAEVVFIWPGATDGTIWEMEVCLSNFRRKLVFFAPKLNSYLTNDEDKKLRAEFLFIVDVLREAGYETPVLFGRP